jgi:hypothetical protein
MEKVEAAWGSVDSQVHTHYFALREALRHQAWESEQREQPRSSKSVFPPPHEVRKENLDSLPVAPINRALEQKLTLAGENARAQAREPAPASAPTGAPIARANEASPRVSAKQLVEHGPALAEDNTWQNYVIRIADWAGKRLGELDSAEFDELRNSPLLARIAQHPEEFGEYWHALGAAVAQREKSEAQVRRAREDLVSLREKPRTEFESRSEQPAQAANSKPQFAPALPLWPAGSEGQSMPPPAPPQKRAEASESQTPLRDEAETGAARKKVPQGIAPAQSQNEPEPVVQNADASLLELVKTGELSTSALELPKTLEIAQWQRIGHALTEAEAALKWWLADWWIHGEHACGDRKALVDSESWTGPSLQTLMTAGWVAKSIPPLRRRKELSFRHHAEVASLTPDAADQLLDWCLAKDGSKKPRTVRELRAEIVRRQAAENPAPVGEPARAKDEETPSAEFQETTRATLNSPAQEPLREPAGGRASIQGSLPLEEDHEDHETLPVTPSLNRRYAVLIQTLRELRDDPPDPFAVAELATEKDLDTLTPVRNFFLAFYGQLRKRFPLPQQEVAS